MSGLLRDTLKELIDRKIIFIYLIITLIAVLISLFSGSVEMNLDSFGNSESVELKNLGLDLDVWLLRFVSIILYMLVFITVMLSAGIIPHMFIRGRADYYLSKPISRTGLIVRKYISIFLVYGGLISACGLIAYLSGALVHSLFNIKILLLLFFTLVSFGVWLTFSFFFGIVSGKTGSTIVYLSLVWFVQYVLSLIHGYITFGELINAKTILKILDIFYYIFPKTGDMVDLSTAIVTGQEVQTYVAGYSTIAAALVVFVAFLFVFKKKNY